MSEVLGEARALIQSALIEIDAESKRLEGALSGLGGSNRATTQKSSRKPVITRSAAPTHKRRKQARKGQRREEVLKAINDEPDTTAAKVARKLDINPSQVSAVAKGLLSDKLVTKKGPSYTATRQAKGKKAESAAP